MANLDTGANEKAARASKTKRFYLAGGNVTADPREADGLRIEFNGFPSETYESKFTDYPEPVRNGLMAFGLHTLLTNAMGGKELEEGIEAFYSRHETLAGGKWSERREGNGGPRISILAEGLAAAMEKAGKPASSMEKVVEYLTGLDEAGRKKIADDKKVKAEVDRIKKERADARAKESAKEAKAAGDSVIGNLEL